MKNQYQFLKIEKKDSRTMVVILSRPEVHNAFNDEMIAEITDCFLKLDRDEELEQVVLTGEGKSFCAGADLNWMKKVVDYSIEDNIKDSQKLLEMFKVLESFSRPIIGKINGHALGGGMGLLSICDYVVCSSKAKLGFTEARLGLLPAVISPFVMKKIGATNGFAYFTSGKIFDAKVGEKIGIIHEVCELEELENKINEVVSDFNLSAKEAKRQCKKLVNENLTNQNIEEYVVNAIAEKRKSEEGQVGMNALLNKEKAPWVK